jgi:hypothetical protein
MMPWLAQRSCGDCGVFLLRILPISTRSRNSWCWSTTLRTIVSAECSKCRYSVCSLAYMASSLSDASSAQAVFPFKILLTVISDAALADLNRLTKFILSRQSNVHRDRTQDEDNESFDPDFPRRDPIMDGQVETWLLYRARELVVLHTIALHCTENHILQFPSLWNFDEKPSELLKSKKYKPEISPLSYTIEFSKSYKLCGDS